MITKIIECVIIPEFQLCLKDLKLQFYATMSTHNADTVYTPGYTLCCWDGIIQEEEADLGYVHTVPSRFLLRYSVNKN